MTRASVSFSGDPMTSAFRRLRGLPLYINGAEASDLPDRVLRCRLCHREISARSGGALVAHARTHLHVHDEESIAHRFHGRFYTLEERLDDLYNGTGGRWSYTLRRHHTRPNVAIVVTWARRRKRTTRGR